MNSVLSVTFLAFTTSVKSVKTSQDSHMCRVSKRFTSLMFGSCQTAMSLTNEELMEIKQERAHNEAAEEREEAPKRGIDLKTLQRLIMCIES